MLSTRLENYIRYLFFTLFFFTPLLLWTTTSEVFEFNKMLFVYSITAIISTLWLGKAIINRRFILPKTQLDLPILLYLSSQVISTFYSLDRHTSLWGYYSRFHGGLVSTICYILLYYAFVAHFTDLKKHLKTILFCLLGSATLISIYAILEHFGIDKNVWVQDVQNRVFSTLGQPNWLSAFLVALTPIPLIYSIENKSHRLLNLCLFLILLLSILFTKSRSGIGATFLVSTLIFAYYLFKRVRHLQSLKPTLPVLACFFAAIIIVGSPWTPNPSDLNRSFDLGGPLVPSIEGPLNKFHLTTQIKPFVADKLTPAQKTELDLKAQGIRIGGSDSMEIRRVVWKGAITLAKLHPLFGTGVETFGYSYFSVRPVEHNLLSEWDFLYNKAHNEYLNTLANTGFFGLGTYLLLCLSILYLLATNSNNNSLILSLFFGYTSILITNYFGFSVVNLGIFFFLFPAIAVVSRPLTSTRSTNIGLPKNLSLITLGFICLYFLHLIYNTWIADQKYATGKAALQLASSYSQRLGAILSQLESENPLSTSSTIFQNALSAQQKTELYMGDAVQSLTTAVKLNPKEPVYLAQLAEAQAQAAVYLNLMQTTKVGNSALDSQAITATKKLLIDGALSNANQAIALNPHHTNFYKSKAKVLLLLVSQNQDYYSQAVDALIAITKLAPTDAKIPYNLGLIFYTRNNQDETLKYLNQAIALKPDYKEAINLVNMINLGLIEANSGHKTTVITRLTTKIKQDPNNQDAKALLKYLTQ